MVPFKIESMYVLVGGPPASGKSSLAAPLAIELGLPLIAKDAIKEALVEALGQPRDVEESRRLGRAAVMAMLTVAASSPGAVLDSTWYPYTLPAVRSLLKPGSADPRRRLGAQAHHLAARRLRSSFTQLLLRSLRCSTPTQDLAHLDTNWVAANRWIRAKPVVEIRCACPPDLARRRYAERSGSRHAGHLDALRSDEELRDPAHSRPLGVGPLIEVDTSGPVSITKLAAQIRALA